MTFLFQGKHTREIAYVAAIVVLRVSIEYFFVPSVAGNADTAALAPSLKVIVPYRDKAVIQASGAAGTTERSMPVGITPSYRDWK